MAQSSNVSLDLVRNIGISAHIDSGKTTLTERILYYTGRIHQIHEVRGKDGVGAKMDSMDLEREKGITIKSAATYCRWKQYQINIIDTPGHVDFTVEVERSLRVLDGAILVLCSVSGVQAQTLTVDRQMKRYKVPRIAFVNKCDRVGANPLRVCAQIREKLKLNAAMIQLPIGLEDAHEGQVDLVKMVAYYYEGEAGEQMVEKPIPANLLEDAKALRHELVGVVADFDDGVGEKFLMEEEVSPEELQAAIRKGALALKFVPVMLGSAYKNKGVQALLDGVGNYLPNPKEIENVALNQDKAEEKIVLESTGEKPLVMLAFKLEKSPYGQLTYMRIYQGTVKKGDMILNAADGKKVKVPRLVRMHSDEMEDIESASAGDIIAMFGVDCASGDTFTDGQLNVTLESMYVADPVISLAIAPKKKEDANNFSKALNKFTKEDPTFRVHRDEESGETIISGMGELHLEIYVERMKREFDTEVIVGKPQVAFRETITKAANFMTVHKKQTGGAGQYAKIGGIMAPMVKTEENEKQHYEFVNDIVGGSIPREFIPACDKGFQEQLKKGMLIGAPVIDVQMTINDGGFHAVDSSEMAFRVCAMTAIRETYNAAGPTILEPIMKVEIVVPEEFQGAVIGQVNQRRGVILGTSTEHNETTIEAEVPLTEMFGYSTDLRSATQGKGQFSMEFEKYMAAPRNVQEEMIKEYQKKRAEESKK
jgi:elongation factor G